MPCAPMTPREEVMCRGGCRCVYNPYSTGGRLGKCYWERTTRTLGAGTVLCPPARTQSPPSPPSGTGGSAGKCGYGLNPCSFGLSGRPCGTVGDCPPIAGDRGIRTCCPSSAGSPTPPAPPAPSPIVGGISGGGGATAGGSTGVCGYGFNPCSFGRTNIPCSFSGNCPPRIGDNGIRTCCS